MTWGRLSCSMPPANQKHHLQMSEHKPLQRAYLGIVSICTLLWSSSVTVFSLQQGQ